jgi:hypothetical protein
MRTIYLWGGGVALFLGACWSGETYYSNPENLVPRYKEPLYQTIDSACWQPTSSLESNDCALKVYYPAAALDSAFYTLFLFPGGAYVVLDLARFNLIAKQAALRGYVAAVVTYPLATSITAEGIMEASVKAYLTTGLMLRNWKDSLGVPALKRNLNRTYLAGHSAGAITALYAGLFSDGKNLPDQYADFMSAEDSLLVQAFAANPIDVAGIINLAGAATQIIEFTTEMPPILHYHGDADATVPIDSGEFYIPGLPLLYGSRTIEHWAKQQNYTKNTLNVIAGGNHNAPVEKWLNDELWMDIYNWMHR